MLQGKLDLPTSSCWVGKYAVNKPAYVFKKQLHIVMLAWAAQCLRR
jgi:hypothetical protein